ncbi:peptidase M1-like protein [Chitinophaga skermanii]|uniref:Peptidase M1-like protein n=1 Tax=Chitinophaga skermanii TaxID=331697 RepID=A0A327QUZ9_9BACT|nr:hypothetical protein [Chitinophaga skermanii]RAJ08506.1 peptidase M1-like protein [Chitinophaga skermanii]
MMRALLTFESRFLVRQYATWISLIVFFGFGILAMQGAPSSEELHKNAAYNIAFNMNLVSLFILLPLPLFTNAIVLRDRQYQMESFIFTTNLQKHTYVFSKYLSILFLMSLLCLVAVLGMMYGTTMISPLVKGPFNLAYFLLPYAMLALPNILLCVSIVFATAIFSRSAMAVYFAAIGMYFLYFLGSMLGNSPVLANSAPAINPSIWPGLLDPFGFMAFFQDKFALTVEEKNTQLLGFSGVSAINRLCWIGISIFITWITYKQYKFALQLTTSKRKATPAQTVAAEPYGTVPSTLHGHVAKRWSNLLMLNTRQILLHPISWLMALCWVVMLCISLRDEFFITRYNINFRPTSGMIAVQMLDVWGVVCVLLFLTNELIWRERQVRIAGIMDALPISNLTWASAKLGALVMAVFSYVTLNILVGVSFQLLGGDEPVRWQVYAQLYWVNGWPILLWAVLVFSVQVIFKNRFVGLGVAILMVGVLNFHARLGFSHYLFRYAASPELNFSDFNGWGYYAPSHLLNMLYGTAWAALFFLLAVKHWPRGFHAAKQATTPVFRIAMVGSILAVVATGWGIYYQTNIQQVYQTKAAKIERAAVYEKQFVHYASIPQPVIKDVKLQVDLFPSQHHYTVYGQYMLKNDSASAIQQVLLSFQEPVRQVTLQANGTIKQNSDGIQAYELTFAQPLQPGDSISLTFSFDVLRNGFSKFNVEHAIVSNGTYVELEKWIPQVGYNASIAIEDPATRAKYQLPPVTRDQPTAGKQYHYTWTTYDVTFSTEAGQTVVSAGELQRTWSMHNRQYFHYASRNPMPFMFAFSSAEYETQHFQHNGIAVSFYYHPGHTYNLAAMQAAAKDALDYCSTHFGAYQYRSLQIAEIPAYGGAATAYPAAVFCAEGPIYMTAYRDATKINQSYAVLAHEISHEWWAGQLDPAPVLGRKVLTETLAMYTELSLLKKKYSAPAFREYMLNIQANYFQGKYYADIAEVPLWLAHDAPYIYYQRGAYTMNRLAMEQGEEAINIALRSLLQQHRYPNPQATVLDLMQALPGTQSAALFQSTQTADFEIKQVQVKGISKNAFQVDISLQQGYILPSPVSIAFYDANNRLIAKEWTRFSTPNSTATYIVKRKPAKVIMDEELRVLNKQGAVEQEILQ